MTRNQLEYQANLIHQKKLEEEQRANRAREGLEAAKIATSAIMDSTKFIGKFII